MDQMLSYNKSYKQYNLEIIQSTITKIKLLKIVFILPSPSPTPNPFPQIITKTKNMRL